MKQFNDLEFKKHMTGEGKQAVCFFENGYGVSVVRFKISSGYGSYTSDETEWELAVIYGNKDGYNLCYDTEITNDVMGHLSEQEVTDTMQKVQQLKPRP